MHFKPTFIRKTNYFLATAILFIMTACSSNTENKSNEGTSGNLMKEAETMTDDGKGIGPVKSLELSATIDDAMAEAGKTIFESKCTACHKLTDERYVGPGLSKVTERRKPEWIMNMIVNPAEMIQKDATAKELLATFMTPMTNQNMTEGDARKILEYFRKHDSAN